MAPPRARACLIEVPTAPVADDAAPAVPPALAALGGASPEPAATRAETEPVERLQAARLQVGPAPDTFAARGKTELRQVRKAFCDKASQAHCDPTSFAFHLVTWLQETDTFSVLLDRARRHAPEFSADTIQRFIFTVLQLGASRASLEDFFDSPRASSARAGSLPRDVFKRILHSLWPVPPPRSSRRIACAFEDVVTSARDAPLAGHKDPDPETHGFEARKDLRAVAARFSAFAQQACATPYSEFHLCARTGQRTNLGSPGDELGKDIHGVVSVASGILLAETLAASDAVEDLAEAALGLLRPLVNGAAGKASQEEGSALESPTVTPVGLDHPFSAASVARTLVENGCGVFGAQQPVPASTLLASAQITQTEHGVVSWTYDRDGHATLPPLASWQTQRLSSSAEATLLSTDNGNGPSHIAFTSGLGKEPIEAWAALQTEECAAASKPVAFSPGKAQLGPLDDIQGIDPYQAMARIKNWSDEALLPLLDTLREEISGRSVRLAVLGRRLPSASCHQRTRGPVAVIHQRLRITDAALGPVLGTIALAQRVGKRDSPTRSLWELPEAVRQSAETICTSLGSWDLLRNAFASRSSTALTASELARLDPAERLAIAASFGFPRATSLFPNEVLAGLDACRALDVGMVALTAGRMLADDVRESGTYLSHRTIVNQVIPHLVEKRQIVLGLGLFEPGLVHAKELPSHATWCNAVLHFIPYELSLRAQAPPGEFAGLSASMANAQGSAEQDLIKARTAAVSHAKSCAFQLGGYGVASICVRVVEPQASSSGGRRQEHNGAADPQAPPPPPPSPSAESALVPADICERVELDPASTAFAAHVARFQTLIPSLEERCRILQQSAAGVREVFYVKLVPAPSPHEGESGGRLVVTQSVRVKMSPTFVAHLAFVVGYVGHAHLRWAYEVTEPLPSAERLAPLNSGWRVSAAHLEQDRQLAAALCTYAASSGRLASPCARLLPALMAKVQQSSQRASDTLASLNQLLPDLPGATEPSRFMVRQIVACAVNAHITCAIARVELDGVDSSVAFRARLSHVSGLQSMIFDLHWDEFRRQMQSERGDADADLDMGDHIENQPIWKNEVWDPENNAAHRAEYDALCMRIANCKQSMASRAKLINEDPLLLFLRATSYLVKPHELTLIPPPPKDKTAPSLVLAPFTSNKGRAQKHSCWLCCRICETSKHSATETTRKAYRTAKWCKTCGLIPLCDTRRRMWGNLSCSEVFHSRRLVEVPAKGLSMCVNGQNSFGNPFQSQPATQINSESMLVMESSPPRKRSRDEL